VKDRISNAAQVLWTQVDTTGAEATETTTGLVKQAGNVANASATTANPVASSVSVTADDGEVIPPFYDPARMQQTIVLANECKADINTLTSDVNAIKEQMDQLITDHDAVVTKLNDLLSKVQSAGQMA